MDKISGGQNAQWMNHIESTNPKYKMLESSYWLMCVCVKERDIHMT